MALHSMSLLRTFAGFTKELGQSVSVMFQWSHTKLYLWNYYLVKMFPSFWLIETTRIIHHNQLLWPNLKRIFVILNQWRQKCSPRKVIEPLTGKTSGRDCVIFGEQKSKERNGETPLRTRKYFEWIIKQSSNSAFVEYKKILQISEGVIHLGLRLLWITYECCAA